MLIAGLAIGLLTSFVVNVLLWMNLAERDARESKERQQRFERYYTYWRARRKRPPGSEQIKRF